MGRKKVRVPVGQQVRFELLNYERLILRKRTSVPVGDGEARDVDMSIEMSLREWSKLRKAIKAGRNRHKERQHKKMATIHRRPSVGMFTR